MSAALGFAADIFVLKEKGAGFTPVPFFVLVV
jgi:hypothetical protein